MMSANVFLHIILGSVRRSAVLAYVVLDAQVRVDVSIEVTTLRKGCSATNVVTCVGSFLCVAAQVLEELLNILHGDSTSHTSLGHVHMSAFKQLKRVVLELGRKSVDEEVSAVRHEVFVAVLSSIEVLAVHNGDLLVLGQLPFVQELLSEYILALQKLHLVELAAIALDQVEVQQIQAGA